MSYKHLPLKEKNKIEVLNKEGYSSRRIAKILGCHHATIAGELNPCNNAYKAHPAEEDKKHKSSLKGRKNKSTKEILCAIKEKLHLKWSPEQLTGTLSKGKFAFKTICNWIYSGIIDFDRSTLRRKGKSRKNKETRGRFHIGTSIQKRPKNIKYRPPFGHWEIDFYLVDPYSAWQRGRNENSNGLLRAYYPKKTDLAEIFIEELIKNLMELNKRPGKCLNYRTPFELFLHELGLIWVPQFYLQFIL